jgi:ubiquinone/menaquinone biosynthesis C-methylase UbiE
MGIYSDRIFPKVLDWAMRAPELKPLRARTVEHTHGRVLEIGFGAGHNLKFFPASVDCVIAVDPNPGLSAMALERIKRSKVKVEHHQITAERLPFDDASFDCVVSTLTLCSIPDVGAALGEVRRVLKPGGTFFFLEHGLCPDRRISKWQDRLTPFWKVIGDGCHLNRNIEALVSAAGLQIATLENPVLPKVPRAIGYAYLGQARRPQPM